jgi:LacI family transcriptional regulator
VLLETDIPVVVQGVSTMPVQVHGFPLDSVYINNVAAARTAVAYLIERGHTRIGMIAGQKATPARHDREIGYRQALERHGIPLDEQLIVDGDFKEAGGYSSAKTLLNLPARPTAIFAASDLMAVGAFVAIREAGLLIPDDIAVVGFDDIPIAKLVNPALTTVAQFQGKLGQRAAEMLFERLNGSAPEVGYCEEMPYELIVRESA